MTRVLSAAATALREYEASLEENANRYRGLYGIARAAELSGDRQKAREHFEKLVALTGNAEAVRPDTLAARRYLARQ